MGFGLLPKDASGNMPISSVYVPGDTFRALRGSLLTNTDANSNLSVGVVTSEIINELILAGAGYSVSTGFQSNGASGNFPFAIFNPSTNTKNILIYSIVTCLQTLGAPVQINNITADPAYGTNPAPINSISGGPNSSLSSSISYTTTSQSPPSNTGFVLGGRLGSNSSQELLTNARFILLTKGQNSGVTMWASPSGVALWMFTACYVEF